MRILRLFLVFSTSLLLCGVLYAQENPTDSPASAPNPGEEGPEQTASEEVEATPSPTTESSPGDELGADDKSQTRPPEELTSNENLDSAGDLAETPGEEPAAKPALDGVHDNYPRYLGEEMVHGVAMGARVIYFPASILDNWFAKHGSHWDGQSNLSFGIDYNLRFIDTLELQFGLYWTDLSMRSQFWLENDQPNESADFTRQDISTLSLEANVYGFYEFVPQLSVYYGGGLWAGAVMGGIEKANIDTTCGQAVDEGELSLESCGHDTVFAQEDLVPPIIGFVNLATGLRAELEEQVVIKLEGGFRGYFYGGLSLGAQFF